MEALKLLWPVVAGGVIVPLAQWIKKILPTDFPIQSVAIVSVLAILSAYGIAKIFEPTMTIEQIITFALGTQVASQYVHAGKQMTGGPK